MKRKSHKYAVRRGKYIDRERKRVREKKESERERKRKKVVEITVFCWGSVNYTFKGYFTRGHIKMIKIRFIITATSMTCRVTAYLNKDENVHKIRQRKR